LAVERNNVITPSSTMTATIASGGERIDNRDEKNIVEIPQEE
jgi:hypothetical protein